VLFSCNGDGVRARSSVIGVDREVQHARRNIQFRAHSAVDETVMAWLVKGAEDERRRMKVGSMCLVLDRLDAGRVTSRTRGAGAKAVRIHYRSGSRQLVTCDRSQTRCRVKCIVH